MTIEKIQAWFYQLDGMTQVSIFNRYCGCDDEIHLNTHEAFAEVFSDNIDLIRAVIEGDYRLSHTWWRLDSWANVESSDDPTDFMVISDSMWEQIGTHLDENEDEWRGFDIGDKVRWNDPAINDYPEEERETVANIVYEVCGIESDGVLYIKSDFSEVDAYANELVRVE